LGGGSCSHSGEKEERKWNEKEKEEGEEERRTNEREEAMQSRRSRFERTFFFLLLRSRRGSKRRTPCDARTPKKRLFPPFFLTTALLACRNGRYGVATTMRMQEYGDRYEEDVQVARGGRGRGEEGWKRRRKSGKED
jgi:hypothetical protein